LHQGFYVIEGIIENPIKGSSYTSRNNRDINWNNLAFL